jgi:hypothetical protein
LKQILSESKIIRVYVFLWSLLIASMLILLSLMALESSLGSIALIAGSITLTAWVLGFISLISVLFMITTVQDEVNTRYATASEDGQRFLTLLFYFTRGFFLLVGLVVVGLSFFYKDVSERDLIEISGKLSAIEIYGGKRPILRIHIENYPNGYEIAASRAPDERLEQINNELRVGDLVFLLIEQKFENTVDTPSIPLYGIRTESHDYLTLSEYNQAAWFDNFILRILGVVFAFLGLIYLLTGRIKDDPEEVSFTDIF